MHEIHFCFLPGCVDTGQCCLRTFQRNGSILTVQHSKGQGRAAGNTEEREKKSVLTKPLQDTKRQGTIFVQNFSSWDVQMRPLWFYYLNLKKNLICLTQSFQSPQWQAYSIACFSVGKQRIGNGLSFLFFCFTQWLWCSQRQEGNWTMRAADVEFLF